MTSEFTVVSDHIAVPVHVSGAALGATTADLGGMVKQATECGLKHASPSTTSALEGRNLRMVWAVNGLIKPGLSSVSLRTEADGLPNHVDVERISLQASPQPTFVREMCEMASGSLAAMRDTANPRSVSNN